MFRVQSFYVFDFKILKKHACFKALRRCMSCQIHVMLEVQNLAHVITSITMCVKSFISIKEALRHVMTTEQVLFTDQMCVWGNSSLNGDLKLVVMTTRSVSEGTDFTQQCVIY